MSERSRLSVLLATEDTYPYRHGEVSAWCHALTRKLPDVDFTVFAVVRHRFLERAYSLPAAVRALVTVPRQAVWDRTRGSATDAPATRRQSAMASPGRGFMPVFGRFVREALESEADSPALADAVVALHEYFAVFDYERTMLHEPVRDAFVEIVGAIWKRDMTEEPPPSPGEVGDAWRLLGRLLRVVATPVPRTDVTHSSAAAFCALPCVIAKLRRRTPYVLTEHGIYLRDQYVKIGRTSRSFFVRWFLIRIIGSISDVAYAFADQVCPVCGDNTRWEHWRGVGPERIQVISSGVDPARFSPALPGAPRHDRPLVVSVGPFLREKGQLDLIEAAAILRESVSTVEIRCCGSVDDRDYFDECHARVRRHRLEDTVRFAGPPDERRELYRLADIVALPSLSEAFPHTAVEAMLCGASIVATDIGGVSEALGQTGRLVPARDPRAMADAIGALLASGSTRRSLGEAARARALAYFTEERFVRDYRATYDSFASSADERLRQPDPPAAPRRPALVIRPAFGEASRGEGDS
jgi:polysaccharide biosynthesis protein PelF